MGGLWPLPWRLYRRAEPEHTLNAPTTYIRLPLCGIMGPGGKHPVTGITHVTEHLPSVYFMAASGH